MTELNKHIINNWDDFKDSFSSPFSHPIGIGRKDKLFQVESELKDFLENNLDAVNLWADHQWLQAAASVYNMKIHILTTSVDTPRWTTLKPNNKPNKQDPYTLKNTPDIYLLHTDNVYFDLLVPKNTREKYILSEREPKILEKEV